MLTILLLVALALMGYLLLKKCSSIRFYPDVSSEELEERKLYDVAYVYRNGFESKKLDRKRKKDVVGIKISGGEFSLILSTEYYDNHPQAKPYFSPYPRNLEAFSLLEFRVIRINLYRINPMLKALGKEIFYPCLLYWIKEQDDFVAVDIYGGVDNYAHTAFCIFKL